MTVNPRIGETYLLENGFKGEVIERTRKYFVLEVLTAKLKYRYETGNLSGSLAGDNKRFQIDKLISVENDPELFL